MEAPAVTTNSPINGISTHHPHSSSLSTMTDDDDGVNSKLVIDLEGYVDGHGSYSPSEYYCYSVCDASSAATVAQMEKGCEGPGNATAAIANTIATTSCAVSVGNGHCTKEASMSASIESVVSAAAAFASSPFVGSSNEESEEGAIRRSIIANANRSPCGPKVANGGRSRTSPVSHPAQTYSSSHDLCHSAKTTTTTTTTGGAFIPSPSLANTAPSPFRTGECSTTAITTNSSVRNNGTDDFRLPQSTNRNSTSKTAFENVHFSSGETITPTTLSASPICVTLSSSIITPVLVTTESKTPSNTHSSGSAVGSNKSRKSTNSASNKRSKTANVSAIVTAPICDINGDISTPLIKTGSCKKRGLLNSKDMTTNNVASPLFLDGKQQNGTTSIISPICHSDFTPVRPTTLFSKESGSNSISDAQGENSNDSASEAGLKLKIKRKKMATRQSAASHEIINDKQRNRQNSDDASTSSSSSSCASPAPTAAGNGNLAGQNGNGTEKKRKSSSSSICGFRAIQDKASSPASFISSTSSNRHQQRQQHASNLFPSRTISTTSCSTSPVTVSAAASSTVCSSSSSIQAGRGVVQGSTNEAISTFANVTNAASAIISDKTSSKQSSKAIKPASNGTGAPPRKKSKVHNQSVMSEKCTNGDISKFENEQDTELGMVLMPGLKKKLELEQQDAGTWVRTIGTTTETESLGPCEPGTSVTLEGIVWQETSGGILVVNVTWRGKTYVGTLLDCTKYDWAPPRHCDSPHSENDALISGGVYGSSAASASGLRTPAKSGNGLGSGNGNSRGRKGGGGNRESKRQQQVQQQQQQTGDSSMPVPANNSSTEQESTNVALESNSTASTSQGGSIASGVAKTAVVSEAILEPHSPILYECPLGGCEKKFSALVGVKYHQSSAHRRIGDSQTLREKQCDYCQHPSESVNSKTKENVVMSPAQDGPTRSKLEEALASDAKLSPEERASLESLFKVAEKSKMHSQQQLDGEKSSIRADSPAYSDISEDECGPPPILIEHPPATAVPVVALHSNHPVEKPTAIVEPQPLASTVLALSSDTTPPLSQDSVISVGMARVSDVDPLPQTPKGQKRSQTNVGRSPKDPKQPKMSIPPGAEKNSSTLSTFPTTSRSPDTGHLTKSHSSTIVKSEPASPHPPSLPVQEFVAPGPPPSSAQTSGLQLPSRQNVQSQSSAMVAPRTPTPSQLPLSSPAPVMQLGPTPMRASPHSGPPPHLNMLAPLNHPAFMFNPFTNANGPMFPNGAMPLGVIPSTMGLDPTMAAALMAAGHPAAAMYAQPGGMAAALAAAGFQMGPNAAQPGTHPSMGFGFGPQTSLAVSMPSNILPPSFINGPVPHTAAQLHSLRPVSPAPSLQSQQQQQSLHKIHELADHAKRSNQSDTTSNSALPVLQNANIGANMDSGHKSCTASLSAENVNTSSGSSGGGSGKSRTSLNVPKSVNNVSVNPISQKVESKSIMGSTDVIKKQVISTPLSSELKTSAASTLSSVSPPVQRHLHTHHHTHTYPTLLAPGIDPSYAAMVASQQAAAAAAGVVGPFPPFAASQKP